MRKTFITIIFALLTAAAFCSGPGLKFTGIENIILAQDNTDGTAVETEGVTPRIKSKKKAEYSEGKSPLAAAGLSLLVPGAGEFYGKDYIRSGIFFGIEVSMLSMWYYYESDGDDRSDEYRAYADANFDENLYYGGLLGMTQNALDSLYQQDHNHNGIVDVYDVWNYDYFSNRDVWSYEEKDGLAVNDLLVLSFGVYNGYRNVLDGVASQFTHNLPETKTQQYYEMIGKYHQFACGWNDFNGYVYENGEIKKETIYVGVNPSSGDSIFVEIPEIKDNDSDPSNKITFYYGENGYISPQVDFYEDLRAKTNDAYEMGQNFLMVTLLNHVASAFDASYVIKKKYQIDTQLRIENSEKGDALGLDNYKVTYSIMW